MSKNKENDLQEISILEQNMQSVNLQKQNFSAQLLEIEAALSEIETSKDAYKIIGNIMVKKDAKKMAEELNQKKETVQIRIKSIEKQEEKLRDKIKQIQADVLNN